MNKEQIQQLIKECIKENLILYIDKEYCEEGIKVIYCLEFDTDVILKDYFTICAYE